MTLCFYKATIISADVAKGGCLLLRSPFKVFKSYVDTPCILSGKKFILRIFSACLRLSTSKSNLPFLVFLTVLGISLKQIPLLGMEIIWLSRSLLKIRVQWILGILQLQSPNKTRRFRFIFIYFHFFEKAIRNVTFSLVLCSTTKSNLCWEFTKDDVALLRRGYTTSMIELGVGFRATTNFKLFVDLTVVKVFFLNEIDPQTPPSVAYEIKRVRNFSQVQIKECYIMTVDMDFGFVPGDPVCFDKLSRCD